MNEEDLSEIVKKITSMINSNNTENNNSNIPNSSENNNPNNYSSESSSDYNNSDNFNTAREDSNNYNNSNNSDNSNNFNIDIETILKMKTIMDKMNNTKNDPRANLLLSLKPYLKPSRKDKLDQYIKLLNMGNIIELFRSDDNSGGERK